MMPYITERWQIKILVELMDLTRYARRDTVMALRLWRADQLHMLAFWFREFRMFRSSMEMESRALLRMELNWMKSGIGAEKRALRTENDRIYGQSGL